MGAMAAWPGGPGGPGGKVTGRAGFTAMEALVAVVVLGIAAALIAGPVREMFDRIKLKRAADAVKHMILNARVRSVSNPERLCGVVFRIGEQAGMDDTVFAFLDAVPDRRYEPGRDQDYLAPLVVRDREGVRAGIPSGYPRLLVFRGDGSATASAKIVLTNGRKSYTVDVLASTGRVKVVSP